jgi:glycosyltransferase involved in cell wall biosynthesis
MPSLSAIIPTCAADIDRLAMLRRSMQSALHQLQEGDELLVAADTTDSPLDAVRELCGRLGQEAPEGTCVRFVPHTPGHHDYGHSQLNHAISVARGEYITGCDDDDVWCEDAFEAIREEAGKLPNPAPLLFRFRSYHGPTFWLVPGLLGEGLIGGHCAVFPNIPGKLGQWGARYEGDWDYIESTLQLWEAAGVAPVWVNRLICIARPT